MPVLVPIGSEDLEQRVNALLKAPYRLIMEEVGSAITTGSLSKNRQTRIERLRAKAHLWRDALATRETPQVAYATAQTPNEELVENLMKSNCCYLLPVPEQQRRAIADQYRDDLGAGTELVFGSTANTSFYVRAFHVETNRGPAAFIDAIEGGVFTWNRVEDWQRADRIHELLYAIASIESVMKPEEEHIVLGEDEASQIASSLGYRKPTIFSNGRRRMIGTEQRTHRIDKPDRSWRIMPRSHLAPIGDDERSAFSESVLDYLATTTCERTAHIISGAYAQFMRSTNSA